MNEEQIEQALAAFYAGSASEEELRRLDDWLGGDDLLPPRWQMERACYRALRNAAEIPLPPGLSERLEARIDALDGPRRMSQMKIARWTAGAATILLLGLGICRYIGRTGSAAEPADTFTDPAIAARVARETLVFVSEQLNSGVGRVADASRQVEKANRVLKQQAIKKGK